MLEELARTIILLESYSPLSSPPLDFLKKQHKRFADVAKKFKGCEAPRLMRILTEEALEDAEWILRLPMSDYSTICITKTPEWMQYARAVANGGILDTEYRRYVKAKEFANHVFERSYINECKSMSYKEMRYEYALSPGAVPAWFKADMAALWVEEVIIAYCIIVFSVMDFAEECKRQAA